MTKLEVEKISYENEACRKIVKEIINFGVSQRQMMFIMYLLAMELENIQHVQELTAFIKELDSTILLSSGADNEEETAMS